jgi:hypothetical protein
LSSTSPPGPSGPNVSQLVIVVGQSVAERLK